MDDDRERRYRDLIDQGKVTPAESPGFALPNPVPVDPPVPFKDVWAWFDWDRRDRV